MPATIKKQSHAAPNTLEPTESTGKKVIPVCPTPVNTCPAGKVVDTEGNFLFFVPSGTTVENPVTGTCDDATVESSDGAYSDTVAPGETLVLPDVTYEIYVDGTLQDTITVPAQNEDPIIINWN